MKIFIPMSAAGWLVLAAACCLTGHESNAGPLYDPFLESFQVGTWDDPDKVELRHGYPAALLEPARLDTSWTNAAARVLADGTPHTAGFLTRRVLQVLPDRAIGAAWLAEAREALADLVAERGGRTDVFFLRVERLTMAYGAAIRSEQPLEARAVADAALGEAEALGLNPRDRLVWRLRQLSAAAAVGNAQPVPDALWPELFELGPFDTGNAWTLWVAHRRQAGRPVLPRQGAPEELGNVLGRLSKSWLKPDDLYKSVLAADWQSGLGGVVLPTAELGAHFKRFPDPPSGFEQQGWWVRGQRRYLKGAAPAYEKLADRTDLSPGWRLDIWRRASETRLLRGEWTAGEADLKAALELARQAHGTRSQRQRLREWTEQALVLALAQGERNRAARIHRLGTDAFTGEELAAFELETANWAQRLDPAAKAPAAAGSDVLDLTRHRVAMGQAGPVMPGGATERESFLAAAAKDLWPLWYVWGEALADPTKVSSERRTGAELYLAALGRGGQADTAPARLDSALAIVALRLGGRDWFERLLRHAVDVDAGGLVGWRTPPAESPVPELLPLVRGSELDRHALLGYCLAAGDMRGMLGLAFELPANGLTRAEKRLFLYPLPGPGPIRAALSSADNDPALLLAIARNESLFEPAVRSRAGALGWMQIMPFHYPARGAAFGPENWRIPAVSIRRGDGLVTENRQRYGGNAYRILAAYNAGPEATARWDQQLGGTAPDDIYLAWIGYPETRAYVEKVLVDYGIYAAIIGAASPPAHE